MAESAEIQQIREELKELRYLYRRLAETLIPVKEPLPDEVKALEEEPKEYICEEELLKILRKKAGKPS